MNFLNSTVWKILAVIICVDVFLIMLNGYLRGRLKVHTDAVLGGVWLILLVLMWNFTNWKGMVAGIVVSFVFGAISISFAAKIASKLREKF